MNTVDVLVDHGRSVGLGHLRRSLVLADAFRAAGDIVRVAVPTEDGRAMAAEDGFAVVDMQPVSAADVVVVDVYSLAPADVRSRPEATTVWVDDVPGRPLELADLIVNPNGYATVADYPGREGRSALCGLRYSLVAPAFVALAGRDGRTGVIVAFGGTDDGTLALPVAEAVVAKCPGVPVEVVLSPLHAADSVTASPGIAVHHGANLASLMARRAVYVGAAGGTAYEATAAGLDVVVCSIFDNQERNARHLGAIGAAALEAYDPEALAMRVREAIIAPGSIRPRGGIDAFGPRRIVKRARALAQSRA